MFADLRLIGRGAVSKQFLRAELLAGTVGRGSSTDGSHSVELLVPDSAKVLERPLISWYSFWVGHSSRIPVSDLPSPLPFESISAGLDFRFLILPRILGRYSQRLADPTASQREHGLDPSHLSFMRLHAEHALAVRGPATMEGE
jgi:hypothetical protein